MKEQNYSNHIRYYPAHHFVFYPVCAALIAAGCYCMIHYPLQRIEFALITAAFFLIGWVAFMMRQHYALMNQDRIVRLELRLRYYQATHEKLEHYERILSLKQLAALRFAPDDQFIVLLKRAEQERLSPDAIKKAITNWVPDDMRV